MDDNWIYDVSNSVTNKIQKIVKVWIDIGVANEKFISRSNSLKQHVYDLLDDMLIEENQHKLDLEVNIQNLKDEIVFLCTELKTTVPLPDENSLVKNENSLIILKNDLMTIKKIRVDRFLKLIDKEKEICERLYEYRKEFDYHMVPSDYELEQLSNHIKSLELLREERKENFISKRNKIIDIFNLLVKPVPKDAFIEKIFKDNMAEEVPLSEDFLCQCDHLIHQLLDELERNKNECIKLRNRYAVLFNILYPESNEAIFSQYASKDSYDFTCKTLETLRSDVFLLEQCRLEKMGEFIKNYQYQLRDKMNLIFLSHFQEKEPYNFLLNTSESSEELLGKLEHELDLFSDIERQASLIVKEIRNWNACFTKLSELKLKLKDPVVLKNRGGILLKVEKEKNTVLKELPKSESRISCLLSSLKSDIITCDDFQINGMRILDYLVYQWNHVDGDKENEKKHTIKNDTIKINVQKSTNPQKKTLMMKTSGNVSQISEAPSMKQESIQRKIQPMKPINVIQMINETPQLLKIDLPQNTICPPSKISHLPIKIHHDQREPGFRIPKFTKIPTKKAALSPIDKIYKKPATFFDRRISRSCTNLNENQNQLTKVQMGSHRNLYKDFCV